MMITNVEFFLGAQSNGAKTSDFGGELRFKPLFCQSVPTNPTKVAEKVYLACFTKCHNISSQNIDIEILFLKKIKKSTR